MDALPPEILDMIIAAVDIGDVDTLRAICSTNRALYGLCRALLIDWRVRYPDIIRLVPDKVADTTRLMAPLDVARFVRAAGFFKKKCALYALRLIILNQATELAGRNERYAAQKSPDDTEPMQGPRPSLVALAGGVPRPYSQTTVSDLETWFRTAPPALGFYGFSPQGDRYAPWPVPESPPTYVIGPLGPNASVVDSPPKLVYAMHYRTDWGPLTRPVGEYVDAAKNPDMIDLYKNQINDALTKAIMPPHSALDAVTRILRALLARTEPDPNDYTLAMPASDTLTNTYNSWKARASPPGEVPFIDRMALDRTRCGEIDLWAAYPETEIYIVTTADMPAPGLRGNYTVIAVSLPLD
ncbi:hypothetical protein pneo_cds_979 [Pandoravirus neocaledonia]|uniref:DUF5902 domain-containing protein n=1 Tax=Pandoravirus neocaledonia TaxID=2107708 RepID=A0A2U7UDT8_9VIRU|nr:hypothetical protein pneo_cds_979 [Pandoravirus neocaledonia]AVK76586.1 hypothetical protein pneo_cds_979 [Pandoravirus neocaledonia]